MYNFSQNCSNSFSGQFYIRGNPHSKSTVSTTPCELAQHSVNLPLEIPLLWQCSMTDQSRNLRQPHSFFVSESKHTKPRNINFVKVESVHGPRVIDMITTTLCIQGLYIPSNTILMQFVCTAKLIC